jgi:hypothetical protein
MTIPEALAKAVEQLAEIIPQLLAKDRAELVARGLDGIELERAMAVHETICYEHALVSTLVAMRDMLSEDSGEGRTKH